MKLLHCAHCREVFSLGYDVKSCSCGATKGKYLRDGLHAVYSGEWATTLGFDNEPFTMALLNQPKEGLGKRFDAFVIPEICPTFIRVEDVDA